jgi:hypothetical protein
MKPRVVAALIAGLLYLLHGSRPASYAWSTS